MESDSFLEALWQLPLTVEEKGRIHGKLVDMPVKLVAKYFIAPTPEGKAATLRSLLDKDPDPVEELWDLPLTVEEKGRIHKQLVEMPVTQAARYFIAPTPEGKAATLRSLLDMPPAVAAPDSTNNAVVLTNILQKLDALGAEVSRTRSASGINVEDFERVVKMLRICGPISEDIDGNLVEDEDILEAMLGDELFWDERYEEQQREEYCKVVEGWLANMKKNQRIRWVNGNRACIKHRFEGLNFDLSSKNDMIAVSRSFRELFGLGALLGVEMKRKRMTKKSLRQAMVEFFLWADASVFPFVQLLTDMQRGGVAFYCKTIDARWGIDLRQVILKDMQEVKAFVSRIGASFPDDLGDDTPNGLIIPETFDDPPRKKFKPLEKPDEGSFSKADEGSFSKADEGSFSKAGEGSSSRQKTGAKRATKVRKALWTIGCRLLENEGDVANLADVMDLDSFQQQEVY